MSRFLFVCWLLVCAAATASVAENWPGWRKDGSGVSGEINLPVEWGPNRNVRWKTRIEGEGISAPIVWGDRVFVTAAVKQTHSVVSKGTVAALCITLMAADWHRSIWPMALK